jgi:hypothetical protein
MTGRRARAAAAMAAGEASSGDTSDLPLELGPQGGDELDARPDPLDLAAVGVLDAHVMLAAEACAVGSELADHALMDQKEHGSLLV